MMPDITLHHFRETIHKAHELSAISEELNQRIRCLEHELHGEFNMSEIELASYRQMKETQQVLQLLCKSYDELDAVLSMVFTPPTPPDFD